MPANKTAKRVSNREILRKNIGTEPSKYTEMPKVFPEMSKRFQRWFEESGKSFSEFADYLSTSKVSVKTSFVKSVYYEAVAPNHFIIMRWKQLSGRSYNYIYEGRD